MKLVWCLLIVLIISLGFLEGFKAIEVHGECQYSCQCKDCSCDCQSNSCSFYRQPIMAQQVYDVFQKITLAVYIKQEEEFIYFNKLVRDIFHPPRYA